MFFELNNTTRLIRTLPMAPLSVHINMVWPYHLISRSQLMMTAGDWNEETFFWWDFRVLLQKRSLFLVLNTCKYFHFKLGSSFIQKRWSYAFKTPWLYSYHKHVWSFLLFGTNTFCFNPCQNAFVPRLALIYPVSHDVI